MQTLHLNADLAGIMYLNMERREDRRKDTEELFSKVELPLVRIPATDGLTLPPEEHVKGLTPGEIGCLRGQVEMWGKVLESGKSWLVTEDDLVPCKDWLDRFNAPIKLPADWTILMLGVSWPQKTIPVNNSDVSTMSAFWGTFSYVLSPRGAAELLILHRDTPHKQADWYVRVFNQQDHPGVYVVSPTWFVAKQSSDVAVRSNSPDRWGKVWADAK